MGGSKCDNVKRNKRTRFIFSPYFEFKLRLLYRIYLVRIYTFFPGKLLRKVLFKCVIERLCKFFKLYTFGDRKE